MTFWESLGLIAVTNFITFMIAVWNFRIRLEKRLVRLETQVELIQQHLGM